MKKILGVLIATFLLVAMVACDQDSDDTITDSPNGDNGNGNTEQIVLTFWNGFTASDGEILRDIVNGFNATNDQNIYIEMDIMPWDIRLKDCIKCDYKTICRTSYSLNT